MIKLPNLNLSEIKKLADSKEGRLVIGFILGRNRQELGAWLVKLGNAVASGNSVAAVTKTVGLAGVKLAGLAAAATLAYGAVNQAISNGEKILKTQDQRSGLETIGKTLWETSIPYVTGQQFGKFWNWLTKHPKDKTSNSGLGGPAKSVTGGSSSAKRTEEKTENSESVKEIKQSDISGIKQGTKVVSYDGKEVRDVTDINRKPTTEENLQARKLGMSQRPSGSGTAQYYWEKERDRRMKKTNHPAWYTKFPQFITTNLQYGVRKEFDYTPVAIGGTIGVTQMIPLKGKVVAQTYKDQMAVLFAKLRGSNSGAFNYTVSDVMAYIECVRGMRIQMHYIAKLIKSINNVDLYLAKTPEPFMRVLGMNSYAIQDLRENRALYVARFNQYAAVLDAEFPTPPDMTVFDRDEYLASIILEEGRGPKSSIYAYHFLQIFRADENNPGQILLQYANYATVKDCFDVLDVCVDAARKYVSSTYTNADTFAKIAGDIFKAYGNAGLKRKFPELHLNDKNVTVFDEYLLHQLQNAQNISLSYNSGITMSSSAPENFAATANVVIPGTGSGTIPKEFVPCNSVAGSNPVIVNTNKANVDGAESISLTRGNWFFDLSTNLTYNVYKAVEIDTCDTVLLKEMLMVYYDSTNAVNETKLLSAGKSYSDLLLEISLWSQLDYAPAFYVFNDANSNGDHWLVEDIDTYAFMTLSQYRALTDTAVISMYKTVDISDQVNFRSVKR